jgi:hypothetical protein
MYKNRIIGKDRGDILIIDRHNVKPTIRLAIAPGGNTRATFKYGKREYSRMFRTQKEAIKCSIEHVRTLMEHRNRIIEG